MSAPYLTNPAAVPLRATRNDLVTLAQAERVHQLGVRLLCDLGIEVLDEDILERLRAKGFTVHGSRLYPEPAVVEEHVAEMRRALQAQQHERQDTNALTLSVSLYTHHLHDPEYDTIAPYSRETLARMTRLVDTLSDEGFEGAVPGYVLDEPAPMQPVTQYLVAAQNARQGRYPVDPTSPLTADYIFQMADALGEPIRGLPVYLPTPLRLGGESLDIVLANIDRLDYISVGSMPSAGASVPVNPLGAFALSAAELLGGLVVMRELTRKPVYFHVSVLPFDLRATSMVFGSPENLLYQLLAADLNRFYRHTGGRGGGNIHVMAKLPGAQAAAEKAAILSAGALLGQRHFSCAGALSLDEVFSPEQLLVDRDIRDWGARLVAGLDVSLPGEEELLDEVRAGLKQGFMAHDRTLDEHMLHTWYPRLFERDLLNAWQGAGSVRLRDKALAEIQARLACHDFHLDDCLDHELQRIWQAAQRKVVGA